MEANSIIRDANGQLMRTQLPPSYYQMQEDQQALRRDEVEVEAKLNTLQSQAKEIEKSALPQPKFTGALHIIDVEGTPMLMLPSPAATSQPTTQPARGLEGVVR